MDDRQKFRKDSFVPTLGMPWKLVQCRDAIVDGFIRPVHIKLFPTNRCNANCAFCNNRNRKTHDEIPSRELLDVIRHFHALGTRAITLGGGGEPTVHPGLNDAFSLCGELDVQVGIITNGLLWSDELKDLYAKKHLVWARMSVVDGESGAYDVERLRRMARNLPEVAVSSYFTVTKGADFKTAHGIAAIAEETENCTHVKFVEETNFGAPDVMDRLEREFAGKYPKSVFQRWEKAIPGQERCLISNLRPLVNADGYVYPCCTVGAWESREGFSPRNRMCRWQEYNRETPPFNGGGCRSCDWNKYNEVLTGMTTQLEHGRFV